MNQKVILILEQIVDNRIIDGIDNKTYQYVFTVQSYHIETKSKASIIKKKNKFYVKTSSFKDALHFIELIGTELRIVKKLLMRFQDTSDEKVKTQLDDYNLLELLFGDLFKGLNSTISSILKKELGKANCKFIPKDVTMKMNEF